MEPNVPGPGEHPVKKQKRYCSYREKSGGTYPWIIAALRYPDVLQSLQERILVLLIPFVDTVCNVLEAMPTLDSPLPNFTHSHLAAYIRGDKHTVWSISYTCGEYPDRTNLPCPDTAAMLLLDNRCFGQSVQLQ